MLKLMRCHHTRDKNSDHPITVYIAAGGTAGHIYPGIAVAHAVQDYGREHHCAVSVRFLGTERGLEKKMVPQAGFTVDMITPIPFHRRVNKELFLLPWNIVRSIWQTRSLLSQHNSTVIIGFGGYVTMSAFLASLTKPRIRFVVHEANVKSGLANRIAARCAQTVLTGSPYTDIRGEYVGIPIRESLATLRQRINPALQKKSREALGLPDEGKLVLVFGGSQGAQRVNTAVMDIVPALLAQGVHVVHSVGQKNECLVVPSEGTGVYRSVHFIEDMEAAYAAADCVIARSGMMTVAEIAAIDIPALFIPLAHGNGEQKLNAQPLVDQGKAKILEESVLTPDRLREAVEDLLEQQRSPISVSSQKAEPSQEKLNTGFENAAKKIARISLDPVRSK